MTLGWWGKCSTFLPSSPTQCQQLWFDLKPRPWDDEAIALPLCHLLLPNARYGGWTWTLDLGMLKQLLYHFAIFSFPLPDVVAGLEPLTLRWWGECSTTLLLSPSQCHQWWIDWNHCPWDDEANAIPLYHLLLPIARCGGWTWILDLGMLKQLLYHFAIFSFPMPDMVAGLEPLTLRWWGECSTTLPSSTSQCHWWWMDWNHIVLRMMRQML